MMANLSHINYYQENGVQAERLGLYMGVGGEGGGGANGGHFIFLSESLMYREPVFFFLQFGDCPTYLRPIFPIPAGDLS